VFYVVVRRYFAGTKKVQASQMRRSQISLY
jgi:hypothetical protein